jgi:PIN domain nuclease of toxin-antitoxin system
VVHPDQLRRHDSDRSCPSVNTATAWEVAVKRSSGKLVAPGDIGGWMAASSFEPLPIEVEHAAAAAGLPPDHKDPFDRMLVAQAQIEDLTLVARDDEIEKDAVALLDASI